MVGKRTKFELADVIRRFGRQFLEKESLSPQQTKVLYNILQCRTASLGGHEEACENCGEIRYSYNSCGDRHCPKCQSAKQAAWIEQLIKTTLPIKHFHITFTVPHVLNKICLFNNKMFYNLMFSAVWRTLHSFGYTHYGVESGAVFILHSWGQNLSLHPHVHCIVPTAGYSIRGEWKNIGKSDSSYLYPIHQLSMTFKGKFMDSLKRKLKKMDMLNEFDYIIKKAWNKKWVVNSQASKAKTENVIRYLGQYTHRVAITNQRILKITQTHVTFIAKDYRDNARKKPISMTGVEFLRRFFQHILPYRFVKIRRYGIYNQTTKRKLDLILLPEEKPDKFIDKEKPKKETSQQRLKRLTGFDVYQCPFCKRGRMIVIRILPRIRSPSLNNRQFQLQTLLK